VALAPRVLDRDATDYLYRAALTPTGPLYAETVLEPLPGWAGSLQPAWSTDQPRYRALCVDGGAMNNEPLDLVRRVLSGYGGSNPRPAEEARRALLLIDPFVNPGQPGPDASRGLIGSIMPLFNALVQNSRFKPEDLALAADPRVGSRFMIAPSRGGDWQAEGAMAAGHLGGFLGFFAEAYRAHDFFLGRRNALNFLRWVFVLPETNPLFAGGRWSEADRARWGKEREGVAGRHLPIIPLCGELERREEALPEWPAGRFQAAEVAPLIERRAGVAVPALRDVLLGMALKRPGFKSWAVRQAATALTGLLTPRLVEAATDKVAGEVRALDAGRHTGGT
jgi:hypothetical protein